MGMEKKSQNSGSISLISLILPCLSKKKEEGRREERRKGEVKKKGELELGLTKK